ncbi:MAG: FMN-binding protein [Thermoanaerobaculia bacterium]
MSAAPGSPRSEVLRLVATLTIAGLFSGLSIVIAYRATLPRIQANQRAALERAVFEVLPDTVRLERLTWNGTALAAGAAGQGKLDESIFAGYTAENSLVGYAVPGSGAGFQDTIKLIYGLDPSGARVLGMKVLESRETPGLGDKIYRDTKFIGEFRELVVEPLIELIKGHGEAANQVDAITGATISSRAVVKILNQTNAIWRPRIAALAAQPRLPGSGTDPANPAAVPPDLERGGPIPGGLAGEKP